MMASHRPSDNPDEQPPAPPADDSGRAAPSIPGEAGSLSPSNFLKGFDWALALGVHVLAFVSVSFGIRNSDVWMHLATGRLISNGEYAFGVDPFSFTTTDRYWVNHTWLFDWGIYQVHRMAGGPGLALGKGIAGYLLKIIF